MRLAPRAAVVAAAIVLSGLITSLIAGLSPSPVHAETPKWFTCTDSSEFKLRRDAEPIRSTRAPAIRRGCHVGGSGSARAAVDHELLH